MVTHSAEYLPVAINGTSYLVEPTQYSRTTIPALRQQQDTGAEPGENTLDQTGSWSRLQTDWSYGAGQKLFDAPDSDRRRFRSSAGVDIWTKGEITLLLDTEQKLTGSNTNVKVKRVTTSLYASDGTDLKYTTNPTASSPTWNTLTAIGSPSSVLDYDSDGTSVFIAYGASNVLHKATANSTAAPTSFGSVNADIVAVASDRLIAADGAQILELDSAGAAVSGSLNYTSPHTGFAWASITGALGGVFAAGNYDSTGGIYYIGVDSSSAAGPLLAPVLVGSLSHGETINCVVADGSVIWVGTSLGFRICLTETQGDMAVGPLVDDTGEVTAIETDGKYAWLSSADGQVYRATASLFTDELTPVWAADVSSGQSGDVQSVARLGSKTYFSDVDGEVWGESGTGVRVSTGTLTVGEVTWNVGAPKAMRYGSVRTTRDQYAGGGYAATDYDESTYTWDEAGIPFDGTVATATGTGDMILKDDENETVTLSSMASGVKQTASFTADSSEAFEITIKLYRDATTTTAAPIVELWQCNAIASPTRTEEILVPIVLSRRVLTSRGQGSPTAFSASDVFTALKALVDAATVVTYEEGGRSDSVIVDRLSMQATRLSDDGEWWEGVLLARLLTV